jgi:hypothetical protein
MGGQSTKGFMLALPHCLEYPIQGRRGLAGWLTRFAGAARRFFGAHGGARVKRVSLRSGQKRRGPGHRDQRPRDLSVSGRTAEGLPGPADPLSFGPHRLQGKSENLPRPPTRTSVIGAELGAG